MTSSNPRLALAFIATTGLGFAGQTRAPDHRLDYDVQAYRLDLSLDPKQKRLAGTVVVDAIVSSETLAALVLDLQEPFDVSAVRELTQDISPTGPLDGAPLRFKHEKRVLTCDLAAPKRKGDRVRVAVEYAGAPKAKNSFDGFHWSETSDGKPWISTSCQTLGSSSWWPCKDSYFHPEDKPERAFINVRVPKGLYAVSNGRLAAREVDGDDEVFQWVHEYPLQTYAVALAVAPYVVVGQKLELAGLAEPLAFDYYVLPENAEKAALQFQDVPRMLAIYSEAFGPYPFPRAKFALVETSFWGMEHSTAVAYGSSYPAWIAAHGGRDPYAGVNKLFDYILIHESAHEWWGNAVSAKAWGDFWIHEGFATYAEGVYVEKTRDRETADRYFAAMLGSIGRKSTLFRGTDVDSEEAYDHVIYYKGACVLNTLRHFVDDDAAWWKSLSDFNLEYRYKNATSADFRAVVERNTQRPWQFFFDQWVYGSGYPELEGTVKARGKRIEIEIDNRSSADTGFDVPIDIAWREGDVAKRERKMLTPGKNDLEIECSAAPTDVKVLHLERLLGEHHVKD